MTLPAIIPSVLDVGCGNGGAVLELGLKHGTKEFHLLEGDEAQLGAKCTGYSKTATTPWRSPMKAMERIKEALPDAKITTYTPSDPWPRSVDLIMSLWSWGFHYPVETYLKRAAKIKAPLLLDLRRGYAGEAMRAVLAAGYSRVIIIETNNKALRVLFQQ